MQSEERALSVNKSQRDHVTMIDTNNWVIEIRSFLLDGTEEDETIPVCIFKVPKTITVYNPEAYTPQLISLGPYHHRREDTLEMDRHKLVVAKRVVQHKLSSLTYDQLAGSLTKLEPRIRACYRKHFNHIDRESITWMMAIDALFLLEFLQDYGDHDNNLSSSDEPSPNSSTKMSYMVDTRGRKIGYDALIRDIFMVENQIPLFVLKKVFHLQCKTSMDKEEHLPKMLVGVCKEISPLKTLNIRSSHVFRYLHLLDLLYHSIVPELDEFDDDEDDVYCLESLGLDGYTVGKKDEQISDENSNNSMSAKEIFEKLWTMISKCNIKIFENLKTLLCSKPMKLVFKFPLKALSKLPILSMIAPAVESIFTTQPSKKLSHHTAVIIEEIMIPSVTSLHEAGVVFCPTQGLLDTIKFDRKTKKLYLPIVNLDVNSEVILRNLVAYEAVAVVGRPLVLARYTEFMNGIIDTAEDAKLLREKGVIVNELKSDKEVADLWNGMSKSVRLTKVGFLDEAIDGVNQYYESTWKVKWSKFMRKSVYGSWQLLLFLATVLLFGLMSLQAFCSVYSCPRVFNIATSTEGDES